MPKAPDLDANTRRKLLKILERLVAEEHLPAATLAGARKRGPGLSLGQLNLDSLGKFTLKTYVEESFSVKLSPDEFMRSATVADLVRLIRKASAAR